MLSTREFAEVRLFVAPVLLLPTARAHVMAKLREADRRLRPS